MAKWFQELLPWWLVPAAILSHQPLGSQSDVWVLKYFPLLYYLLLCGQGKDTV